MVKHKPKVQISNWDEKYIILIRKSVANSDKKYGWRQKGARTVRSSENQDGKGQEVAAGWQINPQYCIIIFFIVINIVNLVMAIHDFFFRTEMSIKTPVGAESEEGQIISASTSFGVEPWKIGSQDLRIKP